MAVSRLSFCASRPLVPCGGCVGSWALSAGAFFWVCGPPSRGRGTKGSLKDTAGRSKLAFSHHLSLLLIHKCCDPLLGCPLCMFHSGVALCFLGYLEEEVLQGGLSLKCSQMRAAQAGSSLMWWPLGHFRAPRAQPAI